MKKTIRVAEPCLDGNEAEYVQKCVKDTWISSRGEFVERFESELAELCGVQHAVVTNNGTTALHLALMANGVGPEDEVIMPTLTYVATANATRYCNAHPVFVDSEDKYFNVDVSKIEAAISEHTKAIVTVPLYGHPVDIDPIRDIADRHNLAIVEDAAESIGASYKGRPVGSLASCSTFSFFGNKLITTGEGGAVVTDDKELADQMRFLRGQAVDPQRSYWHTEIGYNYRMTNVAAAIGVAQLERFSTHLGRRHRVADWYNENLSDCQEYIQLPQTAAWATHSYWMYTIQLKPELNADRDEFMRMMAEQGIETRPVFYPVHWLPPYEKYGGQYPVADDISARGINLPTHGKLTEEDVAYVCEAIKRTVSQFARFATPARRAA